MSEAELAVTMEAVSTVVDILGSLVGKKLAGESGENLRSSLITSAGAVLGGYVASEIACSSVRAIDQDSIRRIQYNEQCKIARETG